MARQLTRLALPLVVLLLVTLPAMATVYKYIDKNGNLVLTDQPVPGAVEVPLHPVMTMPALKGDLQPQPVKKKDSKISYTITITSPAANAIFYRNQDDSIALAVSVDPALQPGSVLQLEVDGKPVDNTELEVDQLDRGSHNVSAAVIDNKGELVTQGPSNVFYVQQHVANPNPSLSLPK